MHKLDQTLEWSRIQHGWRSYRIITNHILAQSLMVSSETLCVKLAHRSTRKICNIRLFKIKNLIPVLTKLFSFIFWIPNQSWWYFQIKNSNLKSWILWETKQQNSWISLNVNLQQFRKNNSDESSKVKEFITIWKFLFFIFHFSSLLKLVRETRQIIVTCSSDFRFARDKSTKNFLLGRSINYTLNCLNLLFLRGN